MLREHVHAGHTPFRRDCRVCQESSAKSKPHRRVPHPLSGTLSIDVAGPFPTAEEDGEMMKYIVVGAFTWLKPLGGDSDPPDESLEEGAELLQIEDDGEGDPRPGQYEVLAVEDRVEDVLHDGEGHPEPHRADGEDGGGPRHERAEGVAEERIEPEINVFRMCLAVGSKSAKVVLQAINAMHIQLRVCGYNVVRLHTDRGGEFRGEALEKWCAVRSIHRTRTAGVSSQSNGRAERSIQEIKARIQRVLKGAEMDSKYWPMACRYVHEMERRRMAGRDEKPVPPFGATVLVKRRFWGRGDFEPTHQAVRYVASDPDNHGHRMLDKEDKMLIAPYYIGKTVSPVTDAAWIALLAERDREVEALDVRRRIRGKVALRSQKMDECCFNDLEELEKEIEEEMEERKDYQKRLQAVIESEAVFMLNDTLESMNVTFDGLWKLKQAMPSLEEEDVLRTRIVSVAELLSEREKWKEPIENEMSQLFEEKKALVKLTDEEFRRLQEKHGHELVVIPMKPVITKKPGPRRRFRMVACVNHVEKAAHEDIYASGADALAVRYALKRASEERWKGVILDIKVAFLNAPLADEEEEMAMVILRPPALLVKLGYAKPGEHYKADKAIYGLRQSPKKWSSYRDRKLLTMVTKDGFIFRPSVAEPNLWKILKTSKEEGLAEIEEINSELFGFILVYVDDLMILSEEYIVQQVMDVLREEWDTSNPEWLGSEKVKFLGMEIGEYEGGFFANQANYIWDKKDVEEVKKAKAPTMKDMYPEPESTVTPDDIKTAQRAVGELLWLSTRTRPEIAYVTSRCSQMILTAPRWVKSMADSVWAYLKNTAEEGIWFGRDGGVNWEEGSPAGLETYSDISFAPTGEGSISHGAIYVTWNKALMWWRSGKQPFPTMSTAESELVEAIEAFTLGDSVGAMIAEHEDPHAKRLLVDNSATVSLLGEGPTSWRTRHLKLRAKNLRWRVSSLDWKINFLPGQSQIADVGTKPLGPQRLEFLKKLMNMGQPPKEAETKNDAVVVDGIKAKAALLLCVAASQIQKTNAAAEGEELDGSYFMSYVIVLYTVFIILITLFVKRCWTLWWSGRGGESHQGIREEGNGNGSVFEGPREDFVRFVENYASSLREAAGQSGQSSQSTETLRRRSTRRTSGTASSSRYEEAENEGHRREVQEHEVQTEGARSPSFSATSAAPPPSPDVNGNLRERFNVFGRHLQQEEHGGEPPRAPEIAEEYAFTITWTGERYHQDHECTGLQNATAKNRINLCGDCLAEEPFVKQRLHGRPGRLLHIRRAHAVALEREHMNDIKTYTPCRVCGPFWERAWAGTLLLSIREHSTLIGGVLSFLRRYEMLAV